MPTCHGAPGFGCSPLWFASVVDAIYDCSSLYQKNYRISGVYKLPPDDFLGSPELEVRSAEPTAQVLPSVLCPLTGLGAAGLIIVEAKGNSRQRIKHTKYQTASHTLNLGDLFCPFKALPTKHQIF